MKIIRIIRVFKPVVLAPALAFFYILAAYLVFSPNSSWIDEYQSKKIAVASEDMSNHITIANKEKGKLTIDKGGNNVIGIQKKENFVMTQDKQNYISIIDDNLLSVSELFKQGLSDKGSTEKGKNIGFIKNVTLEIPKLGILQPLFVMKVGDMGISLDSKPDKDLIDIELHSLYNIDEGYLIGGHSSGYWWDKSNRKDIFKNLEKLEVGDRVIIRFEGTTGKVVENLSVKKIEIGKNLIVPKGDKVIYTCHPYNTSSERLALTLGY